MKSIECPVCGKVGSVQTKDILINGKVYHYYYVAHYDGFYGKTRKLKWHYLGKNINDQGI
ncbi:MAG: hypothetical protein QXF41_03630 [Candidatus Micrarchaeaceae archaeon]